MKSLDQLRPGIEYTLICLKDGEITPLFKGFAGLPKDDFIVARIIELCLRDNVQLGIQLTEDDDVVEGEQFSVVNAEYDEPQADDIYFSGEAGVIADEFFALGIILTLARQNVPSQIVNISQEETTIFPEDSVELAQL